MTYTVKFENGKTVTFEKQPTPQDIDEVANKLGIGKTPVGKKTAKDFGPATGGAADFARDTIKGIASPFLRTGVTLYNSAVGQPQETTRKLPVVGDVKGIPPVFKQGGLVDPKTGKIQQPFNLPGVQQAVGAGVDLGTLIGGGGAGKKIIEDAGEQTLKSLAVRGLKEGAIVGATQGFGQGIQDEKASVGSVALNTALGGIGGSILGAGLPALGRTVTSAGQAKVAQEAEQKAAQDFEKLTGMIIQGKSKDIPFAQKVLSQVDPAKVKTYEDLVGQLDGKITGLSSKLDQALSTNPKLVTLKDLSSSGHNYLEDSLTQLYDYYKKSNDIPGQTIIQSLREKAETTGLTIKEINDIARIHGKDLNAFNVNGELASGLTKKAAENTRSGLKGSVRRLFENPAAAAADAELTSLIHVRDLTKSVAEKATALRQKVQERGWGEKAGRLAFQVIDKLTGGGFKGFVQSFVPRGDGLKVLNAIDLENSLNKNLKLLQRLTSPDITEKAATELLQEIIDSAATGKSGQKFLPVGQRVYAMPMKEGGILSQEDAIEKFRSLGVRGLGTPKKVIPTQLLENNLPFKPEPKTPVGTPRRLLPTVDYRK